MNKMVKLITSVENKESLSPKAHILCNSKWKIWSAILTEITHCKLALTFKLQAGHVFVVKQNRAPPAVNFGGAVCMMKPETACKCQAGRRVSSRLINLHRVRRGSGVTFHRCINIFEEHSRNDTISTLLSERRGCLGKNEVAFTYLLCKKIVSTVIYVGARQRERSIFP